MQIGQATHLFGQEMDHKFESSIGAIYQSFGGIDIYESLQEKAAHLLYFIIKNHGFADGNKRIGAILFVYFLSKNNYLYKPSGEIRIDENTLITLALLVAQSSPNDKEILIKLIITLISD
jgi:prophage maintenance system killer protein